MKNVGWEMSHSVEARVSARFAWDYWTNHGKGVRNWNDPPAKFELAGKFAAGAHGTTRMPGNPPMHWLIRECLAPVSATIEMKLEGATISFEWRFEEIAEMQSRLIQRVVLRGENADAYIAQVESAFKANLADGMIKIARAMEFAAERKNKDARG
jgi:hypothetical protein